MTPEARARLVLTRHARRRLAGVPGTRLSSHDDRLPYCDNPQRVHQYSDTRKNGALKGLIPSIETSGLYPCRKCDKCILFRRLKWRERCKIELIDAPRSWFVTLTFSPMHLAGIRMQAAANTKLPFETAIERAGYKHVQRYLKRLRKLGKTKFRYIAVFEYGSEGGRGHYHLLIHEIRGQKPVLKRVLDEAWRSFVGAKLVSIERPTEAASYVAKYLTKSAITRPRASIGYGKR